MIGAGGVGGYFGGRLAAAGEEVTFSRVARICTRCSSDGLRIQSPKGDLPPAEVPATDRPQAIGPVDVVLFTVKMYDVETAAVSLPPLIGPDTVVITFQNGVEAMDMVARHIGAEHVAGGVAYIVVVIDQPGGSASHPRATAHLRRARRTRSPIASPHSRRRVFAPASRRKPAETSKRICGRSSAPRRCSGMTTVTRSPMGVVREDPELVDMMMSAITEVIAVGKARGISFPPDLMESTLGLIKKFPSQLEVLDARRSRRGRRLELPWLSGAVVRLGKEVGVPTPIHQFIAAVLMPFVNGSK